MNRVEIQDKVGIALQHLLQLDIQLLESDVNERSLTHKLTEYLQKEFYEFHVDCEYNRMPSTDGPIIKRMRVISDGIEHPQNTDIDAKTVYPDIIIHQRGTNEKNLLVIEVKKHRLNSRARTGIEQNFAFDKEKLRLYTAPESEGGLNYQHGLFLIFYPVVSSSPYEEEWFPEILSNEPSP